MFAFYLPARFHTQRTELVSLEELQAAQLIPPTQSFRWGMPNQSLCGHPILKLYNKDTIEYSSWFLYACTCIESTFFFMLALEKHSWCCKIYSTISTSKWYRYSFRHWLVVLLINHWQFSLYRIELQSLSI